MLTFVLLVFVVLPLACIVIAGVFAAIGATVGAAASYERDVPGDEPPRRLRKR